MGCCARIVVGSSENVPMDRVRTFRRRTVPEGERPAGVGVVRARVSPRGRLSPMVRVKS
jgi:hypothetical protein